MKFRLLFCAMLAILCAQLHAQSTGIYVNSSNNVGIGTTNPQAKLQVNGVIGVMDAGTSSHPAGIVTEVGGSLINIGINEGSGNRFGPYIQADKGGMLTIDTRPGYSLFTFAGRAAGSSINGYENPLMSILPTGNVGIGTTSPQSSLHVGGSTTSQISLGSINYGGTIGQALAGIQVAQMDPNIQTGGILYFQTNPWNNPSGHGVYTPQTRMTIDELGNVGIGTTGPVAQLQVQAATASMFNDGANALRLEYTGGAVNGSIGPGIIFAQQWYSGAPTSYVRTGGIYGVKQGGDGNFGGDLAFYTQPNSGADMSERMRIDMNGNVGIGTQSPAYRLDVAGQVHASSFVASSGNNYADFVFKPGYKLESLSAVEVSIKKDGHLPGIPSEAEAKAHGIDLASMQVKLLQKIEELTLHQIEQEKHQIEQDNRIEQLEKENAELRKGSPNDNDEKGQ